MSKSLSRLCRWVIWAALIVTPFWLTACVSTNRQAHAQEPHSGVLLSVTLHGERQAEGLILSVAEAGREPRQFAFTPNTRIPGQYTTFLVRMDLHAGRHSITSLTGVDESGVAIPRFDFVTDMPLEVASRSTGYFGHLELTDGGSRKFTADGRAAPNQLVIADAYEDEIPGFVHIWPALRGRVVARQAPARMRSLPVVLRNPNGVDSVVAGRVAAHEKPDTGDKHVRAADEHAAAMAAPLDDSAVARLPDPAREPFREFLRKGYPRAFVVAASGDTATASGGMDVIERALASCQRFRSAAPESRCRLFAVDDTLILSP